MPKKDEKPIMGLVSDKNYIVANAVENILAGILFINLNLFSSKALSKHLEGLLEKEDLWKSPPIHH